jgi:hypothetical protein
LGVPSSRIIVFVSATKNAAARPKVAPELRPVIITGCKATRTRKPPTWPSRAR